MEQKRDYNLLRPFDLEAAKAGNLLTGNPKAAYLFEGGPVWKYAAGPDVDGHLLVEIISTGRFAAMSTQECFCMAPLAWVEGRPVYKGDVLYSKYFATRPNPLPYGGKFTVTGFRDGGAGGGCLAAGEASPNHFTLPSSCSWTKPAQMVKRQGWVNIYPSSKHYRGLAIAVSGTAIHATKEIADAEATEQRIACVQVEWEEEVSE